MDSDEFITVNNDTLVLKTTPPDSYIGILFQGGCHYSIEIKAPCGSEFKLDLTKQLMPSEDVPCSCGNPKHWFIKYED